MSAGGKMRRKMRPKPASRTRRMYSSSTILRKRPLRMGTGSGVGVRAGLVGSEPTGLTVDVMPYSSA
jgi:hypothetical protein